MKACTRLVDIALDLVNTTQMIVTGLHADPCLGVETEFTVQLNAYVTDSGLCR